MLDEPFSGLDPLGIDDHERASSPSGRGGRYGAVLQPPARPGGNICEAVAIIDQGRLVVSGLVADLRRGYCPRLAVRVTGDRAAAWSA